MTSITKSLESYFNNEELTLLRKNYSKHNNTISQVELNEKAKIIGILYNNAIIKLLCNAFKINSHELIILGAGTQGFIVKIISDNISEALNSFTNRKRIRGPYCKSDLESLKQIALKIQLLNSETSFYEERTIKEESIMHHLNDIKSNTNTNASIIKNVIPKFYLGFTNEYTMNKTNKYFVRFSFMELLDNSIYSTLQFYIDNKKNIYPEHIKTVIYNNIETVVKALWRFKVTHNDLSSRNIMINLTDQNLGDIKLIDFGLAQMFDSVRNNIKSNEEYTNLFKSDPSATNVQKLEILRNSIFN